MSNNLRRTAGDDRGARRAPLRYRAVRRTLLPRRAALRASLRRRAACVASVAVFLLAGGCGPKVGNGDPQERQTQASAPEMDHFTRTLPSGEREEWTLKRGRDGQPVGNGRYTKWHANGQKAAEGNYKDGALDGPITQWDQYGREIGKTRYKKGERAEE